MHFQLFFEHDLDDSYRFDFPLLVASEGMVLAYKF